MKKATIVFSIILVVSLIFTVCFAFAAGTQVLTSAFSENFEQKFDTFFENLEKIDDRFVKYGENIDKIVIEEDNEGVTIYFKENESTTAIESTTVVESTSAVTTN